MALYKIYANLKPVTKNHYKCDLPINVDNGNKISGKFLSDVTSELTVAEDDFTIAWHYLIVNTTLTQGTNVVNYEYQRTGNFYPLASYNVTSKVDAPYVHTGSRPLLEIRDTQRMFTTISPLTVTSSLNFYFDGTITAEKPYDITCYTKNIYEDIIVDFKMLSANEVAYEVLQDGVQIVKPTTIKSRRIIVPRGTLKTNNAIEVKLYSLYNFTSGASSSIYNHVVPSDIVTYRISDLKTLTAEEPTNFRIVGTERRIEENILFAWDMTDIYTSKTTIEIWQDGYKIAWHTGITNKQYIMLGGTLKTTNSTELRLYNVANVNGYTATSRVVTLRVSDLKTIAPILKDFTLSGFNRDYEISVIPDCEGADGYKVNNVGVLTMLPGTLRQGLNSITLEAWAKSSVNVYAKTLLTKEFTITQDNPIIYSLEPSALDINITGDTLVSFNTNGFVNTWVLGVGDKQASGTSERRYMATRGTFSKGINKIDLEVIYAPPYNVNDKRYATKQVEFYGYGFPKLPTFTGSSVHNVPSPVLVWGVDVETDSDKQTAYHLAIKSKQDGTLIEEVEKEGTLLEHKVVAELDNNTEYEVTLKIKNKFNLWSDSVTHTIQTNFSDLPVIDFDLYDNDGKVLLKVDIEGKIPQNFKEIKVYRKISTDEQYTMIADKVFVTDSVIDYAVPSGVECMYKVRLYGLDGTFSESPVKVIKVAVNHYTFTDIDNYSNAISLPFATASIKAVSDEVAHMFANAEAPEVYRGSAKYETIQLKVTIETEKIAELKKIISKDTLLYKDYRSNRCYVSARITGIDKVNYIFSTITIDMMEVRHNEVGIYSSDTLKEVILLNDSYALDGKQFLRGYTIEGNI